MIYRINKQDFNKKISKIRHNIFLLLPYLLIFLLIIYFVSDILTSEQTYHENANRIVSKSLLVSIVLISFISDVICFFKFKTYKKTNVFICIFVCSFLLISVLPLFRQIMGGSINFNTLTLFLYPFSFLLIMFFFMQYPLELISKKILRFSYYIILFLCIFFMLFYYFKVQSTPLSSLNFRKAIFSHIYILVGLFPIAIFLFDTTELLVNYFIVLISIIISDKGVPLISFILLFMFGLLSKIIKNKKTLFIVLLSIFSFIVGLIIIDFLFLNNTILKKIFDQSMLIRIDGYKKILDDLKTFDAFQLIFGKGASAVIDSRGLAAHNDFLEYLYDYGIFGFLLFLNFILFLVLCFIKRPSRDEKSSLIIEVILVILFPITFFSALFTNTNILLFVSIGIIMNGCIHKNSFYNVGPNEKRSVSIYEIAI